MNISEKIDLVEGGELEALPVYAELKKQAAVIAAAIKKIEPLALDEADDYHEKTFKVGDFTFTKSDGGRRWSFKNCQSWIDLEYERKQVEDKLKVAYEAREKGLNTISEDGEEVTEFPLITFTKSSLKLSYDKP
jgi:hypothetical protein